jgi:hypothetical protein
VKKKRRRYARVRVVKRAGIAICALAAAAALAGCGGSSSNSEPSTSTTTTTTPSTTTASGSNKRLSASQWQTYQTKNKTFVSVTNKAIAKFQSCGAVSGRTTSPEAYAKCMGDATTKVIDATTDLGTTLHGFLPSLSGQCTTSLNNYIGALYQWRSVVKTVDTAIKSAAPGSSGAAANARTQYPQVQDAAKTFTKDCKPA